MARQTPEERRKHKRFRIGCPIRFFDRGGKEFTQGKTADISDGGVFAPVPIRFMAEIGQDVNVTISVPRSTPNTYMLEDFASQAKVIRHMAMQDSEHVGLALQFERPLDLAIEV